MKRILYIVTFLGLSTAVYAQQTDTTEKLDYAPVDVGKPPSGDTVLSLVEQLPEFPGGTDGLLRYLSQNLKYPAEARKKDIEGRVLVKFVVCKDGTLCDEEVVKGIGGGCEQEVIRVVKAMPKWKPGRQGGEPVKVYYTLPVTFKFEEEKKGKK